ncbi:MAG: nucleotidyl transferase AbiEii/AbiGii toxin family protein [Candidatus Roizmanbacteria bacterium]|nr:nucleotidyl transferase AbiEii/AbiGii toxin family protein [Candidatus Roizmanbacteria bacterium]
MITRHQLEIVNRKSLKYPLHIAEKDYLLTLVLQVIATSNLGKTLIFKGGTALHHCYLEQYRFSEDLDFSSNQTAVSLEEVRKIFEEVEYLSIKKDYLSGATVKVEKLQYIGPLVQPNSLKVEIDFLQNVILAPQVLKYQNVWGVDFTVSVMDIREICAEKIRAMSDRARYRDFYDMYLILDAHEIDLAEVIGLVKQKEVRKPITKANIEQNWKIVLTQKETEMGQIYYSRKVEDSAIEEMIRSLPLTEIVQIS